ncbi:uncharacterized protein [Manis javanica]|uniref:uncharacterized protein isoform X2 n=1 Tax=Manis javanica TaxID=9974 RepID=UPI003C6D2BBC
MPARDPWRPARAPRRLLFPTRAENGLPFPLPGPERGRPGAPHCSRVLGRDCRRLATSASAPNSRTEELRGRRVATAVWTVPESEKTNSQGSQGGCRERGWKKALTTGQGLSQAQFNSEAQQIPTGPGLPLLPRCQECI